MEGKSLNCGCFSWFGVSHFYNYDPERASREERRSRLIDRELRESHSAKYKISKILLLGCSQSGKSTVLKQLRILLKNDFTDIDLRHLGFLLNANVLESINQMVKGSLKLSVFPENDEVAIAISKFITCYDVTKDSIEPELADFIRIILNSKWCDDILLRKNEFELLDSAEYFKNNIDRILSPDFVLTKEDIVRTRALTCGVVLTDIPVENRTLQMLDVSYQSAERRKWLHMLDDITTILFVTDISEYNVDFIHPYTEKKVYLASHGNLPMNRLYYSMNFFKDIICSEYLKGKPVIVFLNKTDIFAEKLARFPFNNYFPKYNGENNIRDTSRYIQKKFSRKCQSEEHDLYFHNTTAVSLVNIDFVFGYIKDILIKKNLSQTHYF